LPHALLRSGDVPEPEGPTSLEGSADDGPDTMREGVDELDGVVVVRGASGPWGRPLGPLEIRAVWRIVGGPMGPMTIKIWRLTSSSSSLPSSSPCMPDDEAPWAGATWLGKAQSWTAHGTTR
jgi:hypothetical protein